MIKTLSTFSAAIALSAALAFAQGPGTPPDPQTMAQMRVNFLSSQLSLTDAQKTTALSIYTNSYTASQTIQSSLQTNRQSIAAAVTANNTATIDQLSLTAGTLSGQLTAISAKAEAAFYAILTTDQTEDLCHPRTRRPGWFRRPGRASPRRWPQRQFQARRNVVFQPAKNYGADSPDYQGCPRHKETAGTSEA
jgi:hypothetical protein